MGNEKESWFRSYFKMENCNKKKYRKYKFMHREACHSFLVNCECRKYLMFVDIRKVGCFVGNVCFYANFILSGCLLINKMWFVLILLQSESS